ncbi:MAG: holo-ACP synthase [Lentisphaeria bacterium]|nr:holo-ACP synthase [Lentisphaeria bacterium]
MQIIGLGTDIVEIARLKKVLENNQEHFVSRVFTPAESALAESKKNSISCYAGRWAAKEAAAKALGCGIGKNCSFTDIEIINDPAGRPLMSFSGSAAEVAGRLGIDDIKVSISHEVNYAVATVILSSKA